MAKIQQIWIEIKMKFANNANVLTAYTHGIYTQQVPHHQHSDMISLYVTLSKTGLLHMFAVLLMNTATV